jgi:hypothetical protein
MTAFSGVTDFNSPESANRRLANAAFLQERDLPLFNHMVMEIRRLSHADERIPLPDPVEAGAWQRAFAVYEKLRDREVVEQSRAVQHNQAFAADQRAWNDYVSDREQVLRMLQRGVFDEDVLIDRLDVQLPGDLGPPTILKPIGTARAVIPSGASAQRGWRQLYAGGTRWTLRPAQPSSRNAHCGSCRRSRKSTMSERVEDWEKVHTDPSVWRHRGRGSLWVVGHELLYVPGATLTDIIALRKSVDELGKPPPAEPAKPAPPERHDFPRWITPDSSHITQLDHEPNIWVEGFKFDTNRDSGITMVYVRNETEEARALAPKKKY